MRNKQQKMSIMYEFNRMEDELKTMDEELDMIRKDLEEVCTKFSDPSVRTILIDLNKYNKQVHDLEKKMKSLLTWYDDINKRLN